MLVLIMTLAAGGCAAVPAGGPGADRGKEECDELALEAVESESLDEARRMATRAAECYEGLQRQRR